MPAPSHSRSDLQALWASFGDVPIDDRDRILEPFLDFPAGTNRFAVWRWFDERYPDGVQALTEAVSADPRAGTTPTAAVRPAGGPWRRENTCLLGEPMPHPGLDPLVYAPATVVAILPQNASGGDYTYYPPEVAEANALVLQHALAGDAIRYSCTEHREALPGAPDTAGDPALPPSPLPCPAAPLASYVALAADSPERLRPPDVHRVMNAADADARSTEMREFLLSFPALPDRTRAAVLDWEES